MTTYTTEKTPIGSGAFSYVYKGYNKNNASIPLAVKVYHHSIHNNILAYYKETPMNIKTHYCRC